MEGQVDQVKCCSCLPLLTSLKVASVVLTLLYLASSLILAFFGFYSIGLLPFAVVTLLLFSLSLLYFQGLQKMNEYYMIPFLVAEILVRVVCGFCLCFLWGTFVLSCFDMIIVNSPIKDTTGAQFFFFASVAATILFGIFVRAFFPFYRGYSHVKSVNDRLRLCAEESQYMKINFTSRPTAV